MFLLFFNFFKLYLLHHVNYQNIKLYSLWWLIGRIKADGTVPCLYPASLTRVHCVLLCHLRMKREQRLFQMYTLHPFLRGSRTKSLGNSSEVRQNDGRIMAESLQNHAESRKNHGRIMAESWKNHGRIMAESWQNHGRIITESWQNHGRTMEESWQTHGRIITDSWQNYGRIMADSWQKHGRLIGPHSMQRLIIGIPTRPSPQAYRVH